MDEIAGNHRDQRDQHEGGIGRTAVERHGRQQVVDQVEGWRIGAERVEQHQYCSNGEESDLGRPSDAANEAERPHGEEGQRTGVNEAHILGEVEARPSPRGIPDRALRRPIFDVRAHRAEEIGKSELQEMHGVDRAGGGRREADLGAVRASRQQRGHHDRHGGDDRGAYLERTRPGPRRAREPMRQHKPREHIERHQRDLIASDRHQSANRARGQTRPPRRALERAREKPEGKRQICKADDLAGMLNTRTGRAAERKGHSGDECPARVPASVVEEQNDSDGTEEQIREGHGIEGVQTDRGIGGGQQHVQR